MNGFTTAEDLLRHGADYVCLSQRDIARIVTLRSSGSTGEAKRLCFSAGDLERTTEFFRSGMAHIARRGARVAICLGSLSPNGLGRLLEEGLTRLGTKPTLLGAVTDYAHTAEALKELRPDCIIGLPVPLRRLCLMLPTLSPETVLLSGDYIAVPLRETIERVWGCKVFEHYGMTESGLGLAVQCSERDGRHIRADELSVEIVDSETGEVLPDGDWGEVVFTTLKREAMPLTRYRTGDYSRLMTGVCPCGNPTPRLDRILGRIAERKKLVSVYELDDRLLGYDGLADYEAAVTDGKLRITAALFRNGSLAEVRRRLEGLDCTVTEGTVGVSAAKRQVRTEKEAAP